MSSKLIFSETSCGFTPDLFSRARWLELVSLARRVGVYASDEAVKSNGLVSSPSKIQQPCDDRRRRRRNSGKAPVFRLASHASGCWEICDQTGAKAGLFRTRQAAIKYAHDESPDGNFVIIDDGEC